MPRLPRPLAALAALLSVATVLAACGNDGGGDALQSGGDASGGNASGGELLPAVDVETVVRAQEEIAACRSGQDRRGVARAATDLVRVYDAGSDRIFQFGSGTQVGRPMTEVLEEARTQLQGCGADRAAATLDDALTGGG